MIIEKSIKAKLRKGTKLKCYKVAFMTLDMKPEYIRTKMLVEFKNYILMNIQRMYHQEQQQQ